MPNVNDVTRENGSSAPSRNGGTWLNEEIAETTVKKELLPCGGWAAPVYGLKLKTTQI